MRMTVVGLNCPAEPTGIAIYTGGLAEGLAVLAWDVGVVTGLPHYPQWQVSSGHSQAELGPDRGARVDRRRHPVHAKPPIVNRLLMEVTFGLNAVGAPWRQPEVVPS